MNTKALFALLLLAVVVGGHVADSAQLVQDSSEGVLGELEHTNSNRKLLKYKDILQTVKNVVKKKTTPAPTHPPPSPPPPAHKKEPVYYKKKDSYSYGWGK